MKSVRKLFSLVAIVSIVLISCQKEIVIEDNLDPPLIVNDSNYLDKIYYVDSVGGVKDTFRILSYFYDTQKRVVRILDSSDVGPSFEVFPESSFEYYYNAVDTIPYKSLYQKYSWVSTTTANMDSQTTFHYYNASLNRIKDSVSDYSSNGTNSWHINRYTYTANSIKEIREVAPGVYQTTSAQLDSRGNMIRGEADPDGVFTYEFDNNPSPFARLSNFRALHIWLDVDETTDFYLIKNKNNVVKNIDLIPSQSHNSTWDLSGDYIYRADGYPTRIRDEYSNGEFEIIEFKYKAL